MKLIYYDDIESFIESLQKPAQFKTLRQLDLLEEYGNNLSFPHVKKLNKNLLELRVRGTQEVRLIFTFHESSCYILHGFIKKTQKTPQKEIPIAKKRLP